MNHYAPVIAADERDKAGNLSFYCNFCKTEHHHFNKEGHYSAQCKDIRVSPYVESGYILKRNRLFWDKTNKYNPANTKLEKKKMKIWKWKWGWKRK
jgi:hypothetical protein